MAFDAAPEPELTLAALLSALDALPPGAECAADLAGSEAEPLVAVEVGARRWIVHPACAVLLAGDLSLALEPPAVDVGPSDRHVFAALLALAAARATAERVRAVILPLRPADGAEAADPETVH